MDVPGGRKLVPAAQGRLRGADRSGLGEEGWAEVGDDRIGHPDDTNVSREYFRPSPEKPQLGERAN